MIKLVLWIFLSIAAWQDYHKKSVSTWIYVFFATSGIIIRYLKLGEWSFFNLLGSISAGVVLLWICVLTKGSIGEGDGWFFVISGLYLSYFHNWMLLIYGMIGSCIFGLIYLVISYFQFQCIKRKTIAFLPILLIPGLWVICL